MLKRIIRVLRHIGYGASFFADVPPLLVWLYHQGHWIAAMMMKEPVGSLALLCALAAVVVLVWTIRKIRPIL